jgi:hypothetical protein
MQGSCNFSIFVPKHLSWKVSGKSRRAESETPCWVRRNRASEPCPRPTKSLWKDRGSPRPQPQNSVCVVFAPRTQSSAEFEFLVTTPIPTIFSGNIQAPEFLYLFSMFSDSFECYTIWNRSRDSELALTAAGLDGAPPLCSGGFPFELRQIH